MRNDLLALLVGLGILFYFGMYNASSDDAVDFDPLRPSSLLPILGRGVQSFAVRARDIGQALADAVGNPQRERVDRHLPLKGVEQ